MACDEESMKQFNKLINDSNILVFSLPGCPACVKAKKLLSDLNHSFTYHELSHSDENFFSCIYDKTNSATVPQIFVNRKFIGGFRELTYLTNTGLLNDLTKKEI